MAAGDILLDTSGNEILDADGNRQIDDGAGNGCCCGCPDRLLVVLHKIHRHRFQPRSLHRSSHERTGSRPGQQLQLELDL